MASLKTFIFSFMLAMAIITGIYVALYNGSDFYNIPIDGNYSELFDKMNSTIGNDFASNFESNVESSEGVSDVGASLSLTTKIFQAILLPFKLILPTTNILLFETSSLLGVPSWIIGVIFSLIIISLTIIIISIVRGKDIV